MNYSLSNFYPDRYLHFKLRRLTMHFNLYSSKNNTRIFSKWRGTFIGFTELGSNERSCLFPVTWIKVEWQARGLLHKRSLNWIFWLLKYLFHVKYCQKAGWVPVVVSGASAVVALYLIVRRLAVLTARSLFSADVLFLLDWYHIVNFNSFIHQRQTDRPICFVFWFGMNLV